MKQKFKKLSTLSFVLAIVLFALSFVLFHFLTDTGFVSTWQPEAGKPFVTEMVADLAVLFFFSGIFCRLIAKIFYLDEK